MKTYSILLLALVFSQVACQQIVAQETAPLEVAAAPWEYINDTEILRDITQQGQALYDSGATTPGIELRAALSRMWTDVAAPASFELGGDMSFAEKVTPGILVFTGLYLCDDCDNLHPSPASGFIISEDGLAITNYHVMKNQRNQTSVVRTYDGVVVPVAEVLAGDELEDVALVRLAPRPDGLPYHPLPIARKVDVGQHIWCYSHPNRMFYTLTDGVVTRLYEQEQANGIARRLSITAEYAKGSSGGPILNDAGEVVGLVASTYSVYYDTANGRQRNFQMVQRNCVTAEAILDLFVEN